jgi:hypothetical protein
MHTAFAVPLGRVWRAPLAGTDREPAFAACEVATLLSLGRALRNGTVWIEHRFAFRGREQLFIPADRWQQTRGRLIFTALTCGSESLDLQRAWSITH